MRPRMIFRLFIATSLFCGSLAWAQSLGPIGSPLPMQFQRPISTTGRTSMSPTYSPTPFPSGSYRPPTYSSPSRYQARSPYVNQRSLSTRVADFAKFRGVTRGIYF